MSSMSTPMGTAGKPMELTQRRPRQTANPVVSNKPDIYLEFNTSKLGIRVRSGDDKMGLYVAAVTNEAPPDAKNNIPEGSQIISVNEHNLDGTPFDKAVEHFSQLTLPITVRFRPPLYPPKKSNSHSGHGHHHDHDHDHHHSEDDDEESTCYIACYMILFVIAFMVVVSMGLNGFPGIPTQLPSMPRLFPKNRRRSRDRKGNQRDYVKDNNDRVKEQLRQRSGDSRSKDNSRKILGDIVGDMNNIQNILNDVHMGLDDVNIEKDQLFASEK